MKTNPQITQITQIPKQNRDSSVSGSLYVPRNLRNLWIDL